VAQEALRTIARHAQSNRAYVRLTANERALVLCVRDWGVEFEVAARGRAGLGLQSMRERALLIKARLAVRTPSATASSRSEELPCPALLVCRGIAQSAM
jgi:signal transduction histidine kinase